MHAYPITKKKKKKKKENPNLHKNCLRALSPPAPFCLLKSGASRLQAISFLARSNRWSMPLGTSLNLDLVVAAAADDVVLGLVGAVWRVTSLPRLF
ncbi:hypothetical protein HanIR_Chr12g0566061 [Helianthus annuus]|nr:hypothetical protein HanIR_Chr12g0566061 [Helianthus annuus]